LINSGVGQYDKIGIISNNRYEWAVIACAAYSLNASLVPMYEAQLPSDWCYIINDSGATVLFCSTDGIFDRVNQEVLPMTPQVHSVLCLDEVMGEDYGYQTAVDRIRQHNFEDAAITPSPPTPDDLANLI
jgi:long-chain acyl-CoA synthetase